LEPLSRPASGLCRKRNGRSTLNGSVAQSSYNMRRPSVCGWD
jgi:hypothetical protein